MLYVACEKISKSYTSREKYSRDNFIRTCQIDTKQGWEFQGNVRHCLGKISRHTHTHTHTCVRNSFAHWKPRRTRKVKAIAGRSAKVATSSKNRLTSKWKCSHSFVSLFTWTSFHEYRDLCSPSSRTPCLVPSNLASFSFSHPRSHPPRRCVVARPLVNLIYKVSWATSEIRRNADVCLSIPSVK